MLPHEVGQGWFISSAVTIVSDANCKSRRCRNSRNIGSWRICMDLDLVVEIKV